MDDFITPCEPGPEATNTEYLEYAQLFRIPLPSSAEDCKARPLALQKGQVPVYHRVFGPSGQLGAVMSTISVTSIIAPARGGSQ